MKTNIMKFRMLQLFNIFIIYSFLLYLFISSLYKIFQQLGTINLNQIQVHSKRQFKKTILRKNNDFANICLFAVDIFCLHCFRL